jgi:diaminopimelate epimerase
MKTIKKAKPVQKKNKTKKVQPKKKTTTTKKITSKKAVFRKSNIKKPSVLQKKARVQAPLPSIKTKENEKVLTFTKMVASGNDFIVFDNRNHTFNTDPQFIRKLCSFHTGIGADGVLLVEDSDVADFKMRIFNPDGSEPSMCGNGARCIGLYAWEHKLIPQKYTMETLAGIIKGEIETANKVKIFLGTPKDIKLNLESNLQGEKVKIHSINTGVPHAIIYSTYLNKIDVDKLGKEIRWSPLFRPNGTNVDFVQVLGKNRIAVRTYERGVEGETLACGTGVTASAIISAFVHNLKPVIYVETKSGEILIINVNEVSLTGPAKNVFEGRLLQA